MSSLAVVSAPSTSARLRALQQGRGAGFLAAIGADDEDAVVAEILACVMYDPRWDRQLETREVYYAELLLALDADVAPIWSRLVELAGDEAAAEAGAWLPIGVLTEMAARGSASASALLDRAIGEAILFRECFLMLEESGGSDLVKRVVSTSAVRRLVHRVTADQLIELVDLSAAPWDHWAREVRELRFLVERRGGRAALSPARRLRALTEGSGTEPLDDATPTAYAIEQLGDASGHLAFELLDGRRDRQTTLQLLSAATGDDDAIAGRALALLGRRGYTGLIDDAEEFLRAQTRPPEPASRRRRTGYIQYLESMPPELVLPRARKWLLESWPLDAAAVGILERHATADDRAILESVAGRAMTTGALYHLCGLLEAIGRIASPASIPFLRTVHQEVPYAWARRRALRALMPHTGDPAIDRLFFQALWDCEPDTRALACEGVDLERTGARRRVEDLRNDVREDAEVRAAARARLDAVDRA
jgi:hypothetical protein